MKLVIVVLFLLTVASFTMGDAADQPPRANPVSDVDQLRMQEQTRYNQWVAARAMLSAAQLQTGIAVPAATPAPAAVAAAPSVVDITPIRDMLLSAASLLITGMVGIALAWMRKHLSIMQDVGMNASITNSAQRLGALLASDLQAAGKHISTIDLHNPAVAALATSLISSYPEFSAKLGLTPDKAANIILGEAAKLFGPAAAPPVIAPPVATKLAELVPILQAQIAATQIREQTNEHHGPGYPQQT